jgi:hypothetical protein
MDTAREYLSSPTVLLKLLVRSNRLALALSIWSDGSSCIQMQGPFFAFDGIPASGERYKPDTVLEVFSPKA